MFTKYTNVEDTVFLDLFAHFLTFYIALMDLLSAYIYAHMCTPTPKIKLSKRQSTQIIGN